MAKLMKTRIGTAIVIAMFILVVGFPGFASTVSAARPENGWSAHPLMHVRPMAATPSPNALTPTQIRSAYGLPSAGGAGTTIAIVDAYDDPNVLNDLTVFSTQYGLLPISFVEHKMATTISVDTGWALETSLDVQWAHAIAPNATILLVEARSNSLSDLLAAVNYATSQPNVVAVSMSWGGSEFSTETLYDSYFSSSGITFFASSGDSGAGVIWPSSSPNVVAVGGTTLKFVSGSVVETGWSGSGGGVSRYEPKPAYQTNFGVSSSMTRRARCFLRRRPEYGRSGVRQPRLFWPVRMVPSGRHKRGSTAMGSNPSSRAHHIKQQLLPRRKIIGLCFILQRHHKRLKRSTRQAQVMIMSQV